MASEGCDMEREPEMASNEEGSSDLERLNLAVAYVVQVLDDPTVEVEVGRLNSSLGVVTEVVGQVESRDTALALEAVKVLLSKCLGRGLSKTRISIMSSLLPLVKEEDRQEHGVSQVLDSLVAQIEAPSTALWLSLLCSVSDQLFPCHPFLQSEQFWALVQTGLQHEDPLPRKRGLYLLKRTSDSLLSPGSTSIPCHLLHLGDKGGRQEVALLLDTFFLVLETLEEKQSHLVRQVLSKLEHLASISCHTVSSSSPLHVSWPLIAYQRLFKHPSIALVRWGVESFLKQEWSPSSLSCPHFITFLTGPLLLVLNESKLYSSEGEGEGSFLKENYKMGEQGSSSLLGEVIARAFSSCLTRTFKVLASSQQEAAVSTVLRQLVLAVSSQPWGPVPILWVSLALTQLEGAPPCLLESDLASVCSLVSGPLMYQEPLLRGFAQRNLLLCVLDYLQVSSTSPSSLANLLYSLWTNGVLYYTSSLWTRTAEFLRTSYSHMSPLSMWLGELKQLKTPAAMKGRVRTLEETVTKPVLMICLYLSKEYWSQEEVRPFKTFLLAPEEEPARAYSSDRFSLDDEETSRVELLALLAFLQVTAGPGRRPARSFLHFSCPLPPPADGAFLLHLQEQEVSQLLRRLSSSLQLCQAAGGAEAVDRGGRYVELLYLLGSRIGEGEGILGELLGPCLEACSSPSMVSRALATSLLVRLVGLPLSLGVTARREVGRELQAREGGRTVRELMSGEERAEDISNREEGREWGRQACRFRRDQLLLLLSTAPQWLGQDLSLLEEELSLSLEVGGRQSLVAVLQLAGALRLHSQTFLEAAFTFTFEQRKNEVFWPAMEALLELCLARLELEASLEVVELLLRVVAEGENIQGLFALVMLQLEGLLLTSCRLDLVSLLLPVICRALTQGPVYRKDQRHVQEASRRISELGEAVPANATEGSDHQLDHRVRLAGLNILLTFSSHQDTSGLSRLVRHLFTHLQEINTDVTGKRTRHFENSLIHKVRQRLYQVYTLLAPLLEEQEARQVVEELGEELLLHNQQTSVRYYLEWSMTQLLARHPSLQGDMWGWLARAARDKIGSVSSFIVVLTQVILWKPEQPLDEEIQEVDRQIQEIQGEEDRLERALGEIAPWCMAQQFGTRIVAQVCFRKVWSECERQGRKDSLAKYQVLRDCLVRSVQVNSGNASEQRITEDFYLTAFCPQAHLTVHDVLHSFPRLCQSGQEELVPLPLILQLADSHIPKHHPSSLLSSLVVETGKPAGGSREEQSRGGNVQKKVTPWASMLSEGDMEGGRMAEAKARPHPGLILVASLIDKAPNLGGLTRTCEILGVGSLVLASKNILRDREFQAVSVTAEKWLPITECPEEDLPSFLAEKRQQGYRILAVEQAAESIPLQKYKFPPKTVLLLGKEKEGVPVQLLNQVDDCVEIPQSGLVRSFNVHVTGALVLWEAVRQSLV